MHQWCCPNERYRNKILGYCQSLNFIAGFFLSVFDEDTAFWLLTVRGCAGAWVCECVRAWVRGCVVAECRVLGDGRLYPASGRALVVVIPAAAAAVAPGSLSPYVCRCA